MRSLCSLIATLFLLVSAGQSRAQDYTLGPDSMRHEGVPAGTVTHSKWTSKLFPGTERDYWVYVPAQYDASGAPACVMVFQDGSGFADPNGPYRLPVVMDNLIARHEMPVTIAIMIDPGVVPPARPNALPRYNRSFEYDAVTDRYARFLQTEILPLVGRKYHLTADPNGRALGGASSGGICSFTAAWLRPDLFRRVISFVGSFTDLRGGNTFPPLIRKTEPKPVRVFLQDGTRDQDIYSGSWYLGNQDVAAGLKFAGNESQFVVGTGGHSGTHGGAILPDALRFIWKDYPAPIAVPVNTTQPISQVLLPGEGWEAVPGAPDGIRALTSEVNGSLLAATPAEIVRLADSGAFARIPESRAGVAAIAVAPHGGLWMSVPSSGLVLGTNTSNSGAGRTVHARITSLAAANDGALYGATPDGRIVLVNTPHGLAHLGSSLGSITALQLTPDQSQLFVCTAHPGKYISSYTLESNGTTANLQDYFDLELPYGEGESGAATMAVDTDGRLYVGTHAGVQVCDQAGRVIGVLLSLEGHAVTSLAFGGVDRRTLYAVAGGRLYSRKLRVTGVHSALPPIQPPGPRL